MFVFLYITFHINAKNDENYIERIETAEEILTKLLLIINGAKTKHQPSQCSAETYGSPRTLTNKIEKSRSKQYCLFE